MPSVLVGWLVKAILMDRGIEPDVVYVHRLFPSVGANHG